jgi:septum site-determining protein MinC
MLSASASSSTVSYDIKSADLALVALLLKTSHFETLSQDLKKQLADTPDFFDQEPVVIDLGALPEAEKAHEIDFPRLMALLHSYSMLPIALRSGSPAQMQAGKAAGLIDATYARILKTPLASAVAEPMAKPLAKPTAPKSPVVEKPAPLGALVIDKPLRSGQQIYAKGRDLVILAMVNPGAEVIADGNIHVYSTLRGKAIAGARGNNQAMIFAQCMEPELISIAGVYRTSENALPADIWGHAAQVSLKPSAEGEKLVLQRLQS